MSKSVIPRFVTLTAQRNRVRLSLKWTQQNSLQKGQDCLSNGHKKISSKKVKTVSQMDTTKFPPKTSRLSLKWTQQNSLQKGQLTATKLVGETKARTTKTVFSLSSCFVDRSTRNPSHYSKSYLKQKSLESILNQL